MNEEKLQDLRRANLRAWIEDKGGVASALAGRRDIPKSYPSYLSQLQNDYSFGSRAARNCEARLGMPSMWLDRNLSGASTGSHDKRGDGSPATGYVRLPILAEASAGPGADQDGFELIEHVDVAEDWVRRTLRANPNQLRVLTARGHSMAGQIEDGDAMFVEPCVQFVDDGLYVIAVGGLLRVKRLRLRVTDQVLSIESNDGSSPETLPLSHVDDTLRICGRVIGAWSLKRL